MESSARTAAACSLLTQAPPGEYHEVLNDLNILCADSPQALAALAAVAQKYNIENVMEARVADQGATPKILLCPAAVHQDSSMFLDPRKQVAYEIDHAQLKTKSSQRASSSNKRLASLQAELNSYIETQFPGATAIVYAVNNDGKEEFEMHVVNTKTSPENFWNARWHSKWTYKPSTSVVHGKVKGMVHFFEEGNVQLTLDKEFEIPLQSENVDDAEIIKGIKRGEDKYHDAVNEAFVRMNDQAYKRLRRILPLTRTKFDWNKFAAYKLGSELSRK